MNTFGKIVFLLVVSSICFIGYTAAFGLASGIKPAEIISVLLPYRIVKIDPIDKESDKIDKTSKQQKTATSKPSSVDSSSQATAVNKVYNDSLRQALEKIEKEKAELEKLREDVTEKAQAQKREEEERLYNLAKIYEGVDPVQLAVVMANMDDSLVVAILQKMKSQKAGKILESMPVERAAKISSKLLAGENR